MRHRRPGCAFFSSRTIYWIVLVPGVWYLCSINRQIKEFVMTPVTMFQQVSVGLELGQVGRALEVYRVEAGDYPSEAAFQSFMSNAFESRMKKVTLDQWNVPYRYLSPPPNREYEVRSAGPDKRFDSRDDLVIRGKA